ncbi:MAG: hypothetical protein JJU29_03380 [Verrucomicrobia bacterium]|nr:hypothetical protein [Verrucomicrobiota bacterium]MCH8510720.1 hypothetical protein [Kiritimatiellia bacterium]
MNFHTQTIHAKRRKRNELSDSLDKRPEISLYAFMKLIFSFLIFSLPLMALRATPPEILEAELQELRLVLRSLRTENEQLRSRNEMMREEIIRLRRLLTELPETLPAEPTLGPIAPVAPPPGEPEPAPLPGFDVIYVNPTWHYVIFEGGSEDGLDMGKRGRILRDGVEIGTAAITAIQAGQSVADINLDSLGGRGQYPREGDRLMFIDSD